MDNQPTAQIYLADQRGRSESSSVLRHFTFNAGPYRAEGREPFGALTLLNDDTLRASASLTTQLEQPMEVVLLPVVGGLEYTCAGEVNFLSPVRRAVLMLGAGMSYTISNPYETEFINCIQLGFASPLPDFDPVCSQTAFDLTTLNSLLPFLGERTGTSSFANQAFIGRYTGREEGSYTVGSAAVGGMRQVFVFVIQGVFEVANRLLNERDGLALTYYEPTEIEFEALSTDALLILIDLAPAE